MNATTSNKIENVMTANGRVINNSKQEREGWQKVSCTMEYPNYGDRKDTYDAKHYAGVLRAPWYGAKEAREFDFEEQHIKAWPPRNDRKEWLVEIDNKDGLPAVSTLVTETALCIWLARQYEESREWLAEQKEAA